MIKECVNDINVVNDNILLILKWIRQIAILIEKDIYISSNDLIECLFRIMI
jgi:hypothetical protein